MLQRTGDITLPLGEQRDQEIDTGKHVWLITDFLGFRHIVNGSDFAEEFKRGWRLLVLIRTIGGMHVKERLPPKVDALWGENASMMMVGIMM